MPHSIGCGVTADSDPRPQRIGVIIADDHPVVLARLENLMQSEPDIDVLAQCTDGLQAFRAVVTYRPDVLILDLQMPKADGLSVLRRIRRARAATRIVVLAAAIDDDSLVEVLRLGVRGVVPKEMTPDSLVECVRSAYADRQWIDTALIRRAVDNLTGRHADGADLKPILSRREEEVANAVIQGFRNAEIAAKLAIALKVHSRTALLVTLRNNARA